MIGEVQSLRHSNYLLSQQFGSRHRAYVQHIAHILSGPIMDEIQSIWPEEFASTASHRFRGEGQAREVQAAFMMTHYTMERHRETLLSSYWRYRLDKNRDGRLDWNERKSLIEIVARYKETRRKIITPANRSSYDSEYVSGLEGHEKVFEQVGIPFSRESRYQFSSRDGYPFMLAKSDLSKGSLNQPTFRGYHPVTPVTHRDCEFNFNFCLGPEFSNSTIEYMDAATFTRNGVNGSTTSTFERMAYVEYHCGDCLLHILRQESYTPGWGHLMPEDPESEEYKEVATDLAKYNYVAAHSDFEFVMLMEGVQSQRALDSAMRRRNKITYLCTNDDLPDSNLIIEKVTGIYHRFVNARFPRVSPWEKTT